ncbi:MAG TPA: hypothetical protein PKH09_03155, partial [Parvularculaceae bacterium]|nr:hypothetical protein [Parvularculaceae bacterium]
MKRVITFLAAASSLPFALSGIAEAQTLGGFPIREPGASGPSSGAAGGPTGSRNEVIVSKDADSNVKTIAQAMKIVRPGG